MGDGLWRLLESDAETKKRHDRETRDAAVATARSVQRQVESLERLEELQQDQIREQRERAEDERREREFQRMVEESERERERDRPRQEAYDRRLLSRLAQSAGLEDPLAPGRLQADSGGVSLEANAWQAFAGPLRALVEADKQYRGVSEAQVRAKVSENLEHLDGLGAKEIAEWSNLYVWSELDLSLPEHVRHWRKELRRIAVDELAEDPLGPAVLRAAESQSDELIARCKAFQGIIDEAVAGRRAAASAAASAFSRRRPYGVAICLAGFAVEVMAHTGEQVLYVLRLPNLTAGGALLGMGIFYTGAVIADRKKDFGFMVLPTIGSLVGSFVVAVVATAVVWSSDHLPRPGAGQLAEEVIAPVLSGQGWSRGCFEHKFEKGSTGELGRLSVTLNGPKGSGAPACLRLKGKKPVKADDAATRAELRRIGKEIATALMAANPDVRSKILYGIKEVEVQFGYQSGFDLWSADRAPLTPAGR